MNTRLLIAGVTFWLSGNLMGRGELVLPWIVLSIGLFLFLIVEK